MKAKLIMELKKVETKLQKNKKSILKLHFWDLECDAIYNKIMKEVCLNKFRGFMLRKHAKM